MYPRDLREKVKELLIETAESTISLPEEFYQPGGEHYARRLLHLDPEKRFSVVVMVWGPGQGTPLHDHGNHWCVECVLEGKIAVTQYEHLGKSECGRELLKPHETAIAEMGEAGYLIPPFEYHTISNALDDQNSVTIHVYGGDYQECNVFLHEGEGLYKKESKVMSFDN